jgi:hypothetical protein
MMLQETYVALCTASACFAPALSTDREIILSLLCNLPLVYEDMQPLISFSPWPYDNSMTIKSIYMDIAADPSRTFDTCVPVLGNKFVTRTAIVAAQTKMLLLFS